MHLADVILSGFSVGIVIDVISTMYIVGYEFGLSERRGFPLGPIFYVLGFVQLVLVNREPIAPCFLLLLGCLLFYALVIFSGLILRKTGKFIRRVSASSREIFLGDEHTEISNKRAVKLGVDYVSPARNASSPGDSGFIYISSLNCIFKLAIIHILRSGKCVVDVAQDAPGDIKSGRFARDMESYGFTIRNWKITPRKQLVVPIEHRERIPSFIDVLFREYYGCGDTLRLRVEALKF